MRSARLCSYVNYMQITCKCNLLTGIITPSRGLVRTSRAQGCTSSFEKHPYPPKNGGLPRSAVARSAQQVYTQSVCHLISYISSRPPVTLNVPAIPASQKNGTTGGQKTEDGAAGSYSNPYTRDETGPVVPPCLENSTLTYIAQRPAHVHVSCRACARTLSPRSLPAAGASHALTQPANVFFLLRSASCVSGSNS